MVFSWQPTGRKTGEEAKKERGADPLVRVQGDSASILQTIPACFIKKDVHDEAIKTIPYSILELLLLPGVAMDSDIEEAVLPLKLMDPKLLTTLWAVRAGSGFNTTEVKTLDDWFDESIQWAKARIDKEPPAGLLSKTTTTDVHEAGNGDLEDEEGKEEERLEWVRALKAKLMKAQGQAVILEAAKVLFMMGPRNTKAAREKGSDLWEIACLMQALYLVQNPNVASLPPRFGIPKLLKAWASPVVPLMFRKLERFTTGEEAVSALLTISEYPTMAPRAKNLAVVEALPSVIDSYPGIREFTAGERGATVLEALVTSARRRCPQHFDDTLHENTLRALDDEFKDLADRFRAQKAVTMSDKLKVALCDVAEAAAQDKKTDTTGEQAEDTLVGIDDLQKSKIFLDAVDSIRKPLEQGTVDVAELMTAAFQSKCMAIMKHLAGKGDHSKLDPVLKRAGPYRNTKFQVANMRPIAEAIADTILPLSTDSKGNKARHANTETYAPSNQFAFDFISGNWEDCDFVMQLVHRVKLLTEDRKIPRGRSKETWWTEGGEITLTEMLAEVKEVLVPLFTKFLPYETKMQNGIEATLAKAEDAARVARSSKVFGADIKVNLNSFMRDAMRDAGRLWRTAWQSSQADMPIPAEFVPCTSRAAVLLDRSVAQARKWSEDTLSTPQFTAALQRVMGPSQDTGSTQQGHPPPLPLHMCMIC